MDNPVILATVDIQDTGHTRHRTYKTHDIQDTGRWQTKQQENKKNNTDKTENLKRWATQTPPKTGPRGEHR
jgi:hypothetical protein